MNSVRRKVNEVLRSIVEVDFKVSCKASAGGFETPVELYVSGLRAESRNPEIIEQIKELAIADTLRKMDPEKIHKAVFKMDGPVECKAWVMAVLWFAFSADNGEEHRGAWLDVYRRWDESYSYDYTNQRLRDAMLLDLGLTENWIGRYVVNKRRFHVFKVKVGLIIRAPWSKEQVRVLKVRQNNKTLHPYTCGRCGCRLVPTNKGWVCGSVGGKCSYKQNWCHSFDLKPISTSSLHNKVA